MEIALQIVLLIAGFVLLIKGADWFVDGASSTASNFKVPKTLIGLTIIAFGTSAPELAISLKALSSGQTDMVLGNVIGSNILNVLLILGLAAVIRPLMIRKETVRKEIPICILISSLLIVLFLDIQLNAAPKNEITRSDGIAILLFFAVFLYYLIAMAIHARDHNKTALENMEVLTVYSARFSWHRNWFQLSRRQCNFARRRDGNFRTRDCTFRDCTWHFSTGARNDGSCGKKRRNRVSAWQYFG